MTVHGFFSFVNVLEANLLSLDLMEKALRLRNRKSFAKLKEAPEGKLTNQEARDLFSHCKLSKVVYTRYEKWKFFTYMVLCPSFYSRNRLSRLTTKVHERLKSSTDILNMVRDRAKIDIIMKTLFSKSQRAMLKRHQAFCINNRFNRDLKKGEVSASDSSEHSQPDFPDEQLLSEFESRLDFNFSPEDFRRRVWREMNDPLKAKPKKETKEGE